MRFRKKFNCFLKILASRFTKKRYPLLVSWYITYRCNIDCMYCGLPALYNGAELTTSDVLKIIDCLTELGTQIISFCGGEPLMREDMATILDYCKKKDISVYISSNGTLVPGIINYLKDIDLLKLSLDGPETVHDELRGPGTHKKVLAAAALAKKHGIPVIFNMTLTSLNLPYLNYILDKSTELNIPVKFSPLHHAHAVSKNNKDIIPDNILYKSKIRLLIQEAKKNKLIFSSSDSLKYMLDYPSGHKIDNCIAGKIFCHLKPNGDMYPCEIYPDAEPKNILNHGVYKAFRSLSEVSCSECWCNDTMELNMLYNMKFSGFRHALFNR